jgi:hypothetical protein
MINRYRKEIMTGALTGFFISIIHTLTSVEIPFEQFHVFWPLTSFTFGGVAGAVGGWLVKKFGSENYEILSGFFGGLLAYMIQVYIMVAYSIANPTFVP